MHKTLGFLFLILLLLLMPETTEAQCAMCRAALESEADNSQAEGINNGIVYLMAVPYILFGVAVALYFRRFSQKKESSLKS